MWYAPTGFDPYLILAQIATLQAAAYLTLGAISIALHTLAANDITNLSLKTLFAKDLFDVGWLPAAATFLNAIFAALLLAIVVERAKKCLDFAATYHILHLGAVTLCDGFPTSWTWWTVMGVSLLVMSVLGEFFCMRREMREIPLLPLALSRKSSGANV